MAAWIPDAFAGEEIRYITESDICWFHRPGELEDIEGTDTGIRRVGFEISLGAVYSEDPDRCILGCIC
eukprot:1360784-Amorphochlora_amoeboformis.AAC.2